MARLLTSTYTWLRQHLYLRPFSQISQTIVDETESVADTDVVYYLRDINTDLVAAWKDAFAEYPEHFKVSDGDIFKNAPAADAIVSPANSFGFMDGGIDYVYTKHFGQQMQRRLQQVIVSDYYGEVLVGQAAIIRAYEDGNLPRAKDIRDCNGGVPIKFLISAPTMRVPLNVSDTPNSYLAFRAIILAVRRHNSVSTNEKIRSVLMPGLGTAIGRMPKRRCAYQMLQAYETFVHDMTDRIRPLDLTQMTIDHTELSEA